MEYIVLLSVATIVTIVVVLVCKKYVALAAQKKKEYQH